MDIKIHEFKKIISSPIFIVLTLIFLFYNTMLIMNKVYIRDDLKVLNEIVDKIGYVINDDMMIEFKSYYEDKLKEANNILKEKGYSSYYTISKFFNENYIYNDKDSKLNNEEIEFLNSVSTMEAYFFLSSDLEERYENINIDKIAEGDLYKSPYNEYVNSIIKKNYDEFAIRFQELKENNEHKNLFFHGMTYKIHSFLFKDIFKAMIYEIMILIVLSTGFVLNYEFENRTAILIYSTKRGRNLVKDKLIVALVVTILITTIIMGITLLIYFNVFDYSGLWGASINSYFAQEYNMPYMTWWNMSIAKYLITGIIVIYILEVIFCGIAFILASFIRNTYILFGTFAIIVGAGILLPTLIPATLNIIRYTVFTPFTLIINSSWWFMLKSGITTYKYYEIITLIAWSIGVFIISVLCIKKFKRESIQ